MGSAYKKNMKNILGNQDITGSDVLYLGDSALSGAAAAAKLADPHGVTDYEMPRRARLEGVVANIQGTALSVGQVGLELWAAGAVVASGTLVSGGATTVQLLLDKENNNEVLLSAGDIVFLNVGVDVTLSSAQALSARVHLSMLE